MVTGPGKPARPGDATGDANDQPSDPDSLVPLRGQLRGRNYSMTTCPCPCCGMYDGDHWYWCSENTLRSDLTDEQKLEAARIGRLSFKSSGATRRK